MKSLLTACNSCFWQEGMSNCGTGAENSLSVTAWGRRAVRRWDGARQRPVGRRAAAAGGTALGAALATAVGRRLRLAGARAGGEAANSVGGRVLGAAGARAVGRRRGGLGQRAGGGAANGVGGVALAACGVVCRDGGGCGGGRQRGKVVG